MMPGYDAPFTPESSAKADHGTMRRAEDACRGRDMRRSVRVAIGDRAYWAAPARAHIASHRLERIRRPIGLCGARGLRSYCRMRIGRGARACRRPACERLGGDPEGRHSHPGCDLDRSGFSIDLSHLHQRPADQHSQGGRLGLAPARRAIKLARAVRCISCRRTSPAPPMCL